MNTDTLYTDAVEERAMDEIGMSEEQKQEILSIPDNELRTIMIEVQFLKKIIDEAKTKTKKDLYKKKIVKLRKRAQMILYTQYLSGKFNPPEFELVQAETDDTVEAEVTELQ